MTEFELIDRFFRQSAAPGAGVVLGVGDDCALLAPAPGMQLAVSSDMLVEGRHFLPTVAPEHLGHKALAVNLSDLAACGARPLGFTLSLGLPRPDARWLEPFARGLLALAGEHGCALVGGDTTAAPVITLSLTVLGEVPSGGALLRGGACAGDELWVSGHLGDARLALEAFRGTLSLPQAVFEAVRQRMERPTPRVALGQALRGVASSAIDVSDGLAGDLGHVLRQSRVGACIQAELACDLIAAQTVPAWPAGQFTRKQRLDWVLGGGDDYELAFTAPPERHGAVLAAGRASATTVRCIGRIEPQPGLRVAWPDEPATPWVAAGFDHFA